MATIRQGLRFGVSADPLKWNAVGLWIARYDERGELSLQCPSLEFVPRELAGGPTAPTTYLTQEEAQDLADALWAAGFRPQESKQGHGMFEAQSLHLDDMRVIAAAKLGVSFEQRKK